MSTTIAIVTGTADRKGPSTDGGATYPTIPGRFSSADMVADGDNPLFDTILCLADGSINAPFDGTESDFRSDAKYHRLTRNWVAGVVFNTATGSDDRIAIIDLDNADGRDVLHVINWVNHIDGATLPE